MKSLLIAATMLVSVSAMATSAPRHDYDAALGQIKLNNACLTESEVQTINPQTICTKLEARTTGHGGEAGTQTDWVCTAYETKDLSNSRSFERTVCLKHAPVNEASNGECLKWGKKADFLPAKIKIMTSKYQGDVIVDTFSTFSFPTCN